MKPLSSDPAAHILASFALATVLHCSPAMADPGPSPDSTPAAARVHVTITGVPAAEGHLLVGLCDADDYKDFSCKGSRLPASKGEMTHVFSDVAPGQYGVTVLHDRNDNGRMDFKFWGPPKEMWASSRNPAPRMGPSLWEDIVFTVDGADVTLDLRMQ